MTDEQRESTPASNPRDNPCPVCSQTNYLWGEPVSYGGVMFRPKGKGAIDFAEEILVARVCKECGNVQMFLKYHKHGLKP